MLYTYNTNVMTCNNIYTSHTYYGVIKSIWELDYNNFRVPIFRCDWVDMNKGVKVDDLGYTLVNLNKLGFLNDPFVLGKHVKQVCYIDDTLEKFWSLVLKVPEKTFMTTVMMTMKQL